MHGVRHSSERPSILRPLLPSVRHNPPLTSIQFAWGPLSFLTAYLILQNSPWRHPLQALVSSGQFYGNFLYYATNMFEYLQTGVSYSRPEAYYYWSYFVSINAIWIVVPACESVPSFLGLLAECMGRNSEWRAGECGLVRPLKAD